jgi:hypothetical protein
VGVLALDTGIKERWVHRKQRRHRDRDVSGREKDALGIKSDKYFGKTRDD